MPSDQILLEDSWKFRLIEEFSKPYMIQLKAFLLSEKQQGKIIYPVGKDMFSCFSYTPFEDVKVIVLGQDPYHGDSQAHGLSFSVRPSVAIPPSLRNIYKELNRDLHIPQAKHGYLVSWAQQGVLMLNAVLSVEKDIAASHSGKGWEQFTDKVIELLNREHDGLVFLLWGAYAQQKGKIIDSNKHLILSSTHPSPLSAHRGFLGCGHFSKTNAYLISKGKKPINWTLPENP